MIPVDLLYSSLFILCCLFFNIFFGWSNNTRQIQFLAAFLPISCVYWTSSGVGKTIRIGIQRDVDKARGPTNLPVKTCDPFLGSPFRDHSWIPVSSSQNPSTWAYEVHCEDLQRVLCLFAFVYMER